MHLKTESRHSVATGLSDARLSYKFQRLREQIRDAIVRGEFASRLPGERELGRRYKANPKTINKALCDLSREGLVIRLIGRGTFVARQDGRPDAPPRPRVFRCLMPSDSAAGGAYRGTLLGHVRDILIAAGHAWETLTVESAATPGRVPLADWTPATRHATHGLLCYPCEPLSRDSGRPSDELAAEALRRHIPIVVLGACGLGTKLHAVVPDYVDAGFRLTEHLFRIGCRDAVVLRSDVLGRETAMVMTGCRTAAAHCRHATSEIVLGETDGNRGPRALADLLGAHRGPPRDRDSGNQPTLGIVCIGLRTVAAAEHHLTGRTTSGHVAITCLLEPGEPVPDGPDITTYEVDPRHLSAWAGRLLLDTPPGSRPVEVVVPGSLRLAGTRCSPDSGLGTRQAGVESCTGSANVCGATDAII